MPKLYKRLERILRQSIKRNTKVPDKVEGHKKFLNTYKALIKTP